MKVKPINRYKFCRDFAASLSDGDPVHVANASWSLSDLDRILKNTYEEAAIKTKLRKAANDQRP